MTREPAHTAQLGLRVAAALAGIDHEQLWWDCVALGARTLSTVELTQTVHGSQCPASTFNIIALAVNERLFDLGLAPLVTLKPSD